LATIFHRPLNTVRLALSTFKELEMIIINEAGIIKVINWEKHQNVEGMERIREMGRARLKKFREKQKQIEGPKKECNVTETFRNGIDKIRIDKIREEEEIKEVQNAISRSLGEKPGKTPLIEKAKEKAKPNNIEFDQELLSWHGIDEDIINKWIEKFPDLNVNYELMMIREHFKKNPKKSEKIPNLAIYIFSWLEKARAYKIADNIG